jgi:hypothetical protein
MLCGLAGCWLKTRKRRRLLRRLKQNNCGGETVYVERSYFLKYSMGFIVRIKKIPSKKVEILPDIFG